MPLDMPGSARRLARWDVPRPERLSHELREGRSADLTRRRWVVGLSMLSGTIGNLVGLYQTGIIKRLPDPPEDLVVMGAELGKLFNATKVDASAYAYRRAGTPDGLLMTATYAVTAILAGAGGRDRARTAPALPLLMAAKTIYDAVLCVKLAREEWADNHALCEYCQVATVASFASAALALPEALWAIETLMGADEHGRQDQGRGTRREDGVRPERRYRYGADLAMTPGRGRVVQPYDEEEAFNDVAMYP